MTFDVLVFRFLGGCAAASPLANSGALIADIWDVKMRGRALGIFTLAPFAGPALGSSIFLDLNVSHPTHTLRNRLLGPIVGGFIGVSGASWRQVSLTHCIRMRLGSVDITPLTYTATIQLAVLGPHALCWLLPRHGRVHAPRNVRPADSEA